MADATALKRRELELKAELLQAELAEAEGARAAPARMAAPPAGVEKFYSPTPTLPSPNRGFMENLARSYEGYTPELGNSPSMSPKEARASAATVMRAAPLAAGIAFPPTSLATVAGLASTGFLSEMMARGVEGESMVSPEAFAEAGKSAILSGAPIAALKAAKGWGMLGQAAKLGGAAMLTGAGAESVKRGISPTAVKNEETGEIEQRRTYDSLKEAFKDTWKMGAIGGLLGGVGSRLGAFGQKLEPFNDRMQAINEIGAKNRTLAMNHPSLTGWEENVAKRDTLLKVQQAKVRSEITKEFIKLRGEAPPNEEIGRQMQSMTGRIDEAEAAFIAAQDKAAKAKEALAQADAAAAQGLPASEVQKIHDAATAELINNTNAQAASSFEKMTALGNNVTNTAMAGDLATVMKDLSAARTEISKQKYGRYYEKAGISETMPLFGKQDILDAATVALKEHADTATGLSILDDIKRIGSKTEGTHFSSAQLQDLRNHMASAFAGGAEGAMDNAERLASQAYKGITDNARATIKYMAPHSLPFFDDAVGFWANTAEMKNSTLGRSLLQRVGGEAADSTMTALASGIAKGNVDELNKFSRFVELIGKENKAVQTQAMQTMAASLRNAFINKHSETGPINFTGLLDDLAGAAKFDKLPVPVETLGFGDPATIKEWQSVLKKYKPEDVNNPAILDNVLSNPSVQRVLVSGGADAGKIINQATARALFERDVQQQVTQIAMGRTKEAQETAKRARLHAVEANVSAADAESYFRKMQSDPVLSAFSGQGKFTFSNAARDGNGPNTINDLLNRMPRDTAAQFVQALRNKQPALAEIAESRYIANEMSQFIKPNPNMPGGGTAMDFLSARNYFKPSDSDAPYFKMRDILGAKKTDQVKGFVEKVGDIGDQMRKGQTPTDGDIKSLLTLTSTQGAAGLNIPVWNRWALANKIIGMANSKAYNVVAAMFKNPDFARAIYTTSGSIADAMASLPAQKAYPLMMDRLLMEEVGRLDREQRQPQNSGLSPMEPPR